MPSRATPPQRSLRAESGFTLVEVLVAAVVLVSSILGTLTMMDQANRTTLDNRQRDIATNLARDLVEQVRSLPYSSVDPTTIVATLRAAPGLAGTGTGSTWTITRGNVPYAVSVAVCSIDDPSDGTGVHDASFCTGTPAAGTADARPVDYRRAQVTLSWTGGEGRHQVTQSTLVTPEGAVDVSDVTSITTSVASPMTNAGTTSVGLTATTDTAPAGVTWFIDGSPIGNGSGQNNTWTMTWAIGALADGTYVISARAYNSAGTYGPAYQINFTLNRTAPAAPLGFGAGFNPGDGSVDTEWLASPERDVVGYRVYRQQTAPTSGSVTAVNCGTADQPVYVITDTSCTDATAIPPTVGTITPGASSTKQTSNNDIVLNRPSGVVSGNVLIASVTCTTWCRLQAPSGWTLVRRTVTAAYDVEQATFSRVVGAGEPSSYDFTTYGSVYRDLSGGITAYAGVDTSSPIEASADAIGTISPYLVAPSITTTTANARVIAVAGATGLPSSTSPTPPSGLTQEYLVNNSTKTLTMASDKTQAQAGATGSLTTNAFPRVPTGWAAQTIALRPRTSLSGMSVKYWVVAVDRDSSGQLRDGTASTQVDAYVANTAPLAPTWAATPLDELSDGTTRLNWNASTDPDPGDAVTFYRIYRDGVRYDTTAAGTDTSWIDRDPGTTTHDYAIRAVDSHLAESPSTDTVTG